MNNTETATARIFMDGKQAGVELKKLEDQTSDLRREIIKLNKEGKSEQAEARKKDLKFLQKETRKLKEETFDTAKTLKNLNGVSLSQLESAQKKLIKRQKTLNQGSAAYKKNMGDLSAVTAQLKKVRGEMRGVNKTSGGLMSKAKGLLPAFGWTAIISGAVMLTKKLFDLASQTMKYRQQVQKLTGETGQSLADLTASLEASADTFEKDVNEMAVANNTLAKSFGISQMAASKLIDKGFIAGADASGEFLAMLKEYPTQFKAAGLSAEQSIALMTQSVKEGVYSDKGADVIKEGTLRLREMTKATRDALAGIGISSTELEKGLKAGTTTYFDAIQMVSKKLDTLPPQSAKVGTAIADIFSGPGEDAGLEYIKMLGNVNTGMDSLISKSGESGASQLKLLEANKKLEKAWSDMLGTGTGTFTALTAGSKSLLADGIVGLMDGMKGLRDWFIDIYNESAAFRGWMQALLLNFTVGVDVIKAVLNGLWVNIKSGGKLLKAIFTFDIEGIKEAISSWKDGMKETLVDGAKELASDFANAYNETLHGKIDPVSNVVTTKNKEVNESEGTFSGDEIDENKKGDEDFIDRLERLQDEADQETDIATRKLATIGKAEDKHTSDLAKTNKKSGKDKQKLVDTSEKLDQSKLKTASIIAGGLADIAGEETKVGKAALLAKQAIALREVGINLGVGASNTAKVGFPQNIPLLISFAAQAFGIVKSISGFKSGGDTGSNGRSDAAGIVHGQEYVIPANLYKDDPLIASLVANVIEPKRTGIKNIDFPKAIDNIDVIKEYQIIKDREPNDKVAMVSFPPDFLDSIKDFNNQVKNGIRTYIPYSGRGGLKQTTEKYKKIEDSMKFGLN